MLIFLAYLCNLLKLIYHLILIAWTYKPDKDSYYHLHLLFAKVPIALDLILLNLSRLIKYLFYLLFHIKELKNKHYLTLIIINLCFSNLVSRIKFLFDLFEIHKIQLILVLH